MIEACGLATPIAVVVTVAVLTPTPQIAVKVLMPNDIPIRREKTPCLDARSSCSVHPRLNQSQAPNELGSQKRYSSR